MTIMQFTGIVLTMLTTFFSLPTLWRPRWRLIDGKIRQDYAPVLTRLMAFLAWAASVLLMVVAFSVRR